MHKIPRLDWRVQFGLNRCSSPASIVSSAPRLVDPGGRGTRARLRRRHPNRILVPTPEFLMAWFPRNKVVVPIDFSDASTAAVQAGAEMVASPADLHVIHVLVPLDYVHPGALTPAFDESERQQVARRHLDEFLARLGLSKVQAVVRLGDPGLDITEYANEIEADLIVISSHGYHGVKRFLLGSVAERVIRHAHCPVLVLRRPDAD